jgi:hypothetical protein
MSRSNPSYWALESRDQLRIQAGAFERLRDFKLTEPSSELDDFTGMGAFPGEPLPVVVERGRPLARYGSRDPDRLTACSYRNRSRLIHKPLWNSKVLSGTGTIACAKHTADNTSTTHVGFVRNERIRLHRIELLLC